MYSQLNAQLAEYHIADLRAARSQVRLDARAAGATRTRRLHAALAGAISRPRRRPDHRGALALRARTGS